MCLVSHQFLLVVKCRNVRKSLMFYSTTPNRFSIYSCHFLFCFTRYISNSLSLLASSCLIQQTFRTMFYMVGTKQNILFLNLVEVDKLDFAISIRLLIFLQLSNWLFISLPKYARATMRILQSYGLKSMLKSSCGFWLKTNTLVLEMFTSKQTRI